LSLLKKIEKKTITICNFIPIALNKLHKTLVANVDEVNSQQMYTSKGYVDNLMVQLNLVPFATNGTYGHDYGWTKSKM